MFIKYNSINQFRTVIKNIHTKCDILNIIYPTITFTGTVKLHGTNSGVGLDLNNEIWVQSRNNIITIDKDNCGFAKFVNTHHSVFIKLLTELKAKYSCNSLCIYGEWCGSNIQKNVGICNLPKMFVIFDVVIFDDIDNNIINDKYLLNDETYHLHSIHNNIYNIQLFKSWNVDINFQHPQDIQNILIKNTEQVEMSCPVSEQFGKKGTGEGVVYTGYHPNFGILQFKVKGQEHSVTKVKTLASVDIEKINSINEFIDYSVTINRFKQGIEQVFISNDEPIVNKNIGKFIRWITTDIYKEEFDTLTNNNLTMKDVSKGICYKSKNWFMETYG
jgi:hypothetical protein